MCHLIFLLPLAGIPLFFFLPLGFAMSGNAVIWVITAFLGRAIIRVMRKPVKTGVKSLIGSEAGVVSKLPPDRSAQYIVRCRGELWSAYSEDGLEPGQQVEVVAMKGIGVIVSPMGSHRGETDDSGIKPSAAGTESGTVINIPWA